MEEDTYEHWKSYHKQKKVTRLHAMNVFVEKPYIAVPESKKNGINRFRWKSGELFMQYHDWVIHKIDEVTFDCNSGGVPHQHCMDILISENVMY